MPCPTINYKEALDLISWQDISFFILFQEVVWTVVSGILFAHFPTVDCMLTISNFLLTSLTVNERNERENRLFPTLLMHFVSNTLCSRLQHTYFSWQIFKTYFPLSFTVPQSSRFNNVIRKESKYNLIQSTVGKRAKRMPDTTVETTQDNSCFLDLWKCCHVT